MANLRGAQFSGGNFEGAIFNGATLTSANFAGARLENAVFDMSDMSGVKFSDKTRADGATFNEVVGLGIVHGSQDALDKLRRNGEAAIPGQDRQPAGDRNPRQS